MAIAKTNASLYSVEQQEEKSEFSVNIFPIALETSKWVKGIVSGNNVIIVFFQTDASHSLIAVSVDDGATFKTIEMDFIVYDMIYSENLSKFIAVGYTKNATSFKDERRMGVSEDGFTWLAEDWGDLGCGYEITRYTCIRESSSGFYVIGLTRYGTSDVNYFVSSLVQLDSEGSCAYSYISDKIIADLTRDPFEKIIKGNERSIFNNYQQNLKDCWGMQTGDTLKKTEHGFLLNGKGVVFVDGYFVRFDGNNVHRSLNGVDYTFVCTSAYELKQICKHNGYYYCFAESKVCRVKNIADLAEVDSSEYLDIETCSHTAIASMDDYMLLCADGFIFKTTIDDPKKDATTLTVETLSATESLKQSKEYTDEQLAAIIARIEALEGTTTE